MKLSNNYYILLFCTLLIFSMSSCLDEKEELYDVVGPVATIPVFTATSITPGPLAPGSLVRLTVRYYSPNIAVKELRISETVGTGEKRQILSKPITGFDTQNSYEERIEYTIPANAGGNTLVLEAVAVTENDLTGTRTLTLTIP